MERDRGSIVPDWNVSPLGSIGRDTAFAYVRSTDRAIERRRNLEARGDAGMMIPHEMHIEAAMVNEYLVKHSPPEGTLSAYDWALSKVGLRGSKPLSDDARQIILDALKEAMGECAKGDDFNAMEYIVTLMRQVHGKQ